MNCQEFWDSLPEVGANADVQHAAECEACASLLNRHRRLVDGLKTVAAELRHTGAPARVEVGLVAAFRSHQRPVRRAARPHWWVPALSWAAAAGVLIVAALSLLHPHQPLPAHRNASSTVEMAAVTDSTDAVSYTHLDVYKRQAME